MTLADWTTESADVLVALLAALPDAQVFAHAFSTEVFVANLDPARVDEETVATLEHLAKKIEVGRRLRRAYSVELARPILDEPVGLPFAQALAGAFVHYGCARQDWKWINTALKMDWGILLEPEFQMPEPAKLLLDKLLDASL